MTDRTRVAYDTWSTTYDTDPNPQIELEEPDVLALLDPRASELILDAACGTGRYAAHAIAAGASVVGIDFSAGMLEIARRRLPGVQLVQANLEQPLPLPSATFHKIVCAQALKHLPLLAPVFREFERVMRGGGSLVFSVTHPEMDWCDYELSASTHIVLSAASDIYHHAVADYMRAIEDADLSVAQLIEITVSSRIAHLLTPSSFAAVAGRRQILAMRVVKS